MANPSHPASVVQPISLDLTKADIINPDSLRPVYSNNAAVLITPHDLRILFSEVLISGPADTQPKVELRANVTMAPTQFKALATVVAQTLQNFENQFGEIAWPPKQK